MRRASAEIIDFPGNRRNGVSPDARLQTALACLNAALEQQREAVAAWRDTIDELDEATRSVEDSLTRYLSHLDRLRIGLVELHGQPRQSQGWGETSAPDSP